MATFDRMARRPSGKKWHAHSRASDRLKSPRSKQRKGPEFSEELPRFFRRNTIEVPATYLERWCGGWAVPWHRADLGFFGAHALPRCARVARMHSCGPLLATHFLLEKQVEARHRR